MPATIDTAYVETFTDNLRFKAQQTDTRLRGWIDEEHLSSEGHNFDILGATEANKKTSRLQDTPVNDYPWTRRKSIPVTYDTGESTELNDPTQMMIDPNSKLVRAMGMTMKRAWDDEIIAAAVGDSRDGAGNTVAFDTGQNIGDGTTSISFDLVTQVSERFGENDIDEEAEKVFVISPRQARKLLQLTEVGSSDYNSVKSIVDGKIVYWMGFHWIKTNRLPDASVAQDGSEEYCFAMTRDAIGVQVNQDISVEVGKHPGKSFSWMLYSWMQIGGVRVEDEHLVRCRLSRNIAA